VLGKSEVLLNCNFGAKFPAILASGVMAVVSPLPVTAQWPFTQEFLMRTLQFPVGKRFEVGPEPKTFM
jgi:hypothetical protein